MELPNGIAKPMGHVPENNNLSIIYVYSFFQYNIYFFIEYINVFFNYK